MEFDKKLHFWAGFGASAFALILLPVIWAFIAGLAAGLGKELHDLFVNWRLKKQGKPPRHTVDIDDMGWTVVGSAAAVVIQGVALAIIL